jgi:tRNA threonylcarbamoyladenosine biosynthesis protein TsaB
MSAALTLALDASTYTGSVALLDGERVISEREVAMRGEKEERLMPAVEGIMAEAGVRPSELGRVACGGGPGSFTSLRIAAAIGKGIAAGRGIPLYSVSSLLLLVAGSASALTPGRYLAVMDALRGDVYAAGYEYREPSNGDGRRVEFLEMAPLALVERGNVAALADSLGARSIGPGEKIAALPRASGFARLTTLLDGSAPVDLALWEPDYGRLAEAQVRWEREHGKPLRR